MVEGFPASGLQLMTKAQDLEIQRIRRQLEEDAQARTPIAYQVHDAAAQAVEIRASGYGFQLAAAASAQIPQASAAQANIAPTGVASVSPRGTQGPTTSGNAVLDAVLLGVQQLQTLQAQQLTNPKKADAPETVKTGITAFPKLAPPDPAGGSLEFQDWMQLIAGLMSDFSDSSQLWWSGVVQVSKDAYDKWVVASPIERLTVEPDERPELTEGKWGRVNARACVMLLDALESTVKSDIIARRCSFGCVSVEGVGTAVSKVAKKGGSSNLALKSADGGAKGGGKGGGKGQSVVHATPVLNTETFMQQAVQTLRQLEAIPPRNDATPHSQPPQPKPEGLSTASQPSATPNPSVKRFTIRSVTPASCFPVSGVPNRDSLDSSSAAEPTVEPSPVASQPPLIGYALLDSGATHPMRQASSEEEWVAAEEVQVSLAGDQTTVMRLTRAGTLLLPPGRDGLVQPIVPMGAIIEQLGYKLVWSAGSCKLYPPDGKSLRLRVKNGCPELVESQALTLISRLEEHKMQQVEELRRRTEEGQDRIRQAKIAMERTWWDHLVEHVSSSAPAAGHMAVSTAPFFQDVPDRALSGILPSEDVDSKALWKALEESMPYLNRRRRKALHRASNWIVHLFAGPGSHKAFKRLESQDTVVVELDICAPSEHYEDSLYEPSLTEEVEEEEGVSEDSFREQPVLWELWVPDPQTGEQLCVLRSDDSDASEARALYKSEPVYTPNVELLLDGLQEPLQVVHTVDPRDAEQCIEKWMPAIHKEIGVIEKAVRRLPPAEVRSGGWLRRKDVKVVPSKFVFTVKPPDPAEGEASLASRKGQAYHKRKARLVACGNHAPGTGSEVYASGAAAETLRCFVVISSKRRWCIGSLDVTSAFLLTPIPQGKGFPVFALTPPRLLVRLGLAEEGELWILTHAVYGLRESPKLWSDFRDCQLRALRCVVDGVELQLQQGRLDPNWRRVVRTSDGVVVGGLLTYVDDFLLAGSKEVIATLATAIQGIWKTTPLALATAEHPLRFLRVEILVQGFGFVLSQQAYAEELLRVNDVKVPCPRDLVSFDTLLTDESPIEETVRTAQRLTGEILWLSQRTRPNLAFTACVLASLSTKAPQRAIRIAEMALAYVRRTKALALTADADDTGLIGYSDASYAPEGNRSHTGWVVFFHGSTCLSPCHSMQI
ncbi:Transposon Ty4-H Gag-Pol polyprotein [Symbiodinium microadriaticum]|uniref:Transposon Ty4-H Gag-Pol polyprotein n=1 Tax=Symbiodinium microadriaticum TaxID=2951 RepID=A0A1Q9EEV2_SYMMI|nr:Transposon Ty4-H Gag-Pol polyprotein [Symbiodinium microadriaticum]